MNDERLQKLATYFTPEVRQAAATLSDERWAQDLANTIAIQSEVEICKVLTRIDSAIVDAKSDETAEALAEVGLTIAKETGNITSEKFDIKTITPKQYVQDLKAWRATVQKELS